MGSSKQKSESTTQWIPNEYQKAVLPTMVNTYNTEYAPLSQNLANTAEGMYGNLASQTIDYAGLLNNASKQVASGQNTLASLANGQLTSAAEANITDSAQRMAKNSAGTVLVDLAKRGVITSSQGDTALNNVANNVANYITDKQESYLGTLGNLANSQISNATANISAAQGAQNAAQGAASNILSDSLNAFNAASGILGTGSSTSGSTSNGSGSSNLLSSILGLGTAFALCFIGDSKVETPDGKKRIKAIKVGDKVKSLDSYGRENFREVIEVQEPVERDTVQVITDKGDVTTTMSQPLMCESGVFKEVGVLRVGEKLRNMGKVLGFVKTGRQLVYDLKVKHCNNYVVNGFVGYGMYEEEMKV